MRMILIIIISTFFCGFIGKNQHHISQHQKKNPLLIIYLKETPPDSIQIFLKTYLQIKKVEIITWEQVRTLFFTQLDETGMDWITSGKLSGLENNRSQREKLSNELLKPVCNVLALQVFRKTEQLEGYIIDSIKWQITVAPRIDTSSSYRTYIPNINEDLSPYAILKRFSDLILQSEHLK